MIIDPAASSADETEKLLVGVIVPRPIAFVSTISLDGVGNLAPFNFFYWGVPQGPPVVCWCDSIRPRGGSKKDALCNLEATRGTVINVVSEDFGKQMVACSGDSVPVSASSIFSDLH